MNNVTLAPMSSASACRCCVEEIDGKHCANAVFNAYKNYTHMFAAADDLCNYCNFSHADAHTKQLVVRKCSASTHSVQLLTKLGYCCLQRSTAVRLCR